MNTAQRKDKAAASVYNTLQIPVYNPPARKTKKGAKVPRLVNRNLNNVVVREDLGYIQPGFMATTRVGSGLMDGVMGSRPANYANALSKRVPSIMTLKGPVSALKVKKARKPRAPSEKSLAKKQAKFVRGENRLKKREDAYTKKNQSNDASMLKCTRCEDQFETKKKKINNWYNKIKPARTPRPMSEATKVLLAAIRAAKKAGTYVAPTKEQKRAAANLKAKARRAAKRNVASAVPRGVMMV